MKRSLNMLIGNDLIAGAWRNRVAFPVAAVWLALSAASALAQTTNYVAPTGNDTPGGGSVSNPWLTIGYAVAQTPAGNVVMVSTGLYEITAMIDISKALTVRSWNSSGQEDRENTIIKSDGTNKVMYINHADAWVSGFTITNGGSAKPAGNTYYGAGVRMNGGTLSNCIVSGNTATTANGGGVYMEGNALVTDCRVQYNKTLTIRGSGAGIYAVSGSVKNTEVIGNTAGVGGSFAAGIYMQSDCVLSNCLIAGNVCGANISAGGVQISGTNVLIIDSVISNNVATGSGGGIRLSGSGYATIRDSTIISNSAGSGGGLLVTAFIGGGALVTNCLIAGNKIGAGSFGGGIADGMSGAASTGWLTVANTRIIGNGLNSGYGGGVWILNHGTSQFYNCEIASNTVSGYRGAGMNIHTSSACVLVRNCLVAGNYMQGNSLPGGGIYLETGVSLPSGPNLLDLQVESCTVVNNSASTNNNANSMFGGIKVLTNGTMQVWNTVVVSNKAFNSPDLSGASAYIAPVYYSCSPVLTNAENGNITSPPVFVGYAAAQYGLEGGSPGINAGSNSAWMADSTDLDGRRRIDRLSGRVDMGAYEYLFPGAMIRMH